MIYYTLEKNNGKWIVWKNSVRERSFGSAGIFKALKKSECENWCKENNITIPNRKKKWMI